MPHIFSNERLEGQLWQILDRADPRDRLYVYRILDGEVMKPAVLKCQPFPELMPYLQDRFNGGDFQLLIRRSDRMILAGTIAIAPPAVRHPA
jgi:hypothetical protein